MERLKQKVASSSSRVIASLQQAATGTFQSSSSPSSSTPAPASAPAPAPAPLRTSVQQQNQEQQQQPAPQSQASVAATADQVGSRLMQDADATAHLTEAERQILLQVFKKEAEFQRDTIIQMGGAHHHHHQLVDASLEQQELNNNQQRLYSQQQQQDLSNRVPAGGRRSSQRGDRLALAQRQTSYSTSSRQPQQYLNSQYQSPSFSGSSAQASPSPAPTLEGSNSSATTTTTTASTYLASASRSSAATPSSRPASSVFAGTPTAANQTTAMCGGPGPRRRESGPQRAGSSCSASTMPAQQQPLGQCRICRKFIQTNEPCHLCSNCNQFICDDCASYSASDQHWMCSSCRRRTTKPAIPADALRELGLNQNSSPVRRMTLRLNQTDLRPDLSKGSSESSNSSSGCSSMSAAGPPRPPLQQQPVKQQPPARSSNERQQAAIQQQQQQQPDKPAFDRRPSSSQQQPQPQPQLQRRGSNLHSSAGSSQMIPAGPMDGRYNAQKSQSNPVANNSATAAAAAANSSSSSTSQEATATAYGQRGRVAQRNLSSGSTAASTGGQMLTNYTGATARQQSSARPIIGDRFQPQQQQPPPPRRASVAVPDSSTRGGVARKAQASGPSTVMMMVGRKQSMSGNFFLMQGAGQQNPSHGHQQQFVMGQQPRTLVTASSELSMGVPAQSRRESSSSARGSIGGGSNGGGGGGGGSLIPIPPDQIHLRRLSDQSNLVRRSSIIADTIDVVNMQHRNRSHSNIDTVSYAFYQPQFQAHQPLDYSDENLTRDSTTTLDQQQVQLNSQPARQQQQQISSIITSYSQKQRRSSEDLHTDSSSDIDEDFQVGLQTNLELDSEQPSEYFAPPRGFEYSALEPQQQQHTGGYAHDSQQTSSVPIPSVSVSEFNSSQQRLSQLQLQQQQDPSRAPPPPPPMMQLEQLMTSPIQINVAIEQAIQQQRQRQELVQQYLPASDTLGQPVGPYSALAPRRGSSGRILPQIPSDQSQSLLDLPHSAQAAAGSCIRVPSSANGGGGGGAGGRNSLSNGNSMNGLPDQHQQQRQQRLGSTLDLPTASQTIRRASAPEGQNIKIVVDDMDGSVMRSNGCLSGSMVMVLDPISGQLVLQQQQPGGGQLHQYQFQHQHQHQHQQQQQQQHYIQHLQQHHSQNHQHHLRHPQFGGSGGGGGGGLKQGELYERLVLYRDDSLDPNTNMARGFGLQVMGGKIDEQGKLQACVVWILAGGPADKVGLKCGDKIIEWDGKCLVNMTYEQVADVIESSANIAELLVKPAHRLELPAGSASVVRSQRRLSHQTERDLKKMLQQQQQQQQVSRQQSGRPNTGHSPRSSSQWQRPQPEQQQQQQQNRLLEASSSQQQHHQQALSAGNSPLRSGTGRKLPQIPNGGSGPPSGFSQDGVGKLCALNDNLQVKVNSSSTSQLEQQTATGHYSAQSQHQQQQLLGQLQPEQRTLSAQNKSFQQPVWFHQQQQAVAYEQQPGHYGGAYNPAPTTTATYHEQVNAGGAFLATADEVFGLIGLQVNVDERASQLEISVLSAINLSLNPSLDYFVRLRILPESNRFKVCKTLPRSDLNWKETFLFQNFPIDQINRMALEIGIWLHDEAPRLSTQLAQPICEAMIPIQSARERNTDFWPLRQPPSSSQARRKSLNDLLESHHHRQPDDGSRFVGAQLSAGYNHRSSNNSSYLNLGAQTLLDSSQLQQQQQQQQQQNNADNGAAFVRGRSASNRNLPDTSKLRAQPRRASDEVAGSSSQRLGSRLSPAPSRRSISVINVGGGGQDASCSGAHQAAGRPVFRPASQSNLHLFKGNPQQQQLQRMDSQQQQTAPNSSGDSPVMKYGTHGSPKGSVSRPTMSRQPSGEGLTPSGRRTSLVGIHSMIGYASQKSSLSDASEQAARAAASKTSSLLGSSQRPTPATPGADTSTSASTRPRPSSTSQRTSTSSNSSPPAGGGGQPLARPLVGLGAGAAGTGGSRRGSSVEPSCTPPRLERKGSFAILTLRKLKRTMSLTKGGGGEQAADTPDSNQASRRSSSEYETDVGEDLGLTRRLMEQSGEYVGRLKLSFIMTKGQLEIDVISAQGLKYDLDSSLGVYVKMYLKGRNKSNKRKTRLVQPWESPVFRQLIKYDGCLVDNKSLEVSLWQKQGGLRGKIPIGFTEVRLSELSLNQLQTSWYNLRPTDMMCSSSVED